MEADCNSGCFIPPFLLRRFWVLNRGGNGSSWSGMGGGIGGSNPYVSALAVARAPGVSGPWAASGPQTAPASGLVEFWDLFPPPGQSVYRSVQPREPGKCIGRQKRFTRDKIRPGRARPFFRRSFWPLFGDDSLDAQKLRRALAKEFTSWAF